ncbi:MAG: hypothetical protein WCB04_10075, partial [Mycobacteriales bacterium]
AGGGPSSPPPGSLTAAEQALVDRLPLSLVNPATCVASRDTEDATYTDAAVKCDPAARSASDPGTPPTVVYAGHDRTAALLRKDIDATIASRKLPSGSCDTSPGHGQWNLGTPAKRIGDILCYPATSSGNAVLVWTYDADLIWASAAAPDSSHANLFAWWKSLSIALR